MQRAPRMYIYARKIRKATPCVRLDCSAAAPKVIMADTVALPRADRCMYEGCDYFYPLIVTSNTHVCLLAYQHEVVPSGHKHPIGAV